MQNLFELVGRVEAQVWGVENTCRLNNPRRINVNDSGLRQALIENPFELVDKVEAQVELRIQVLSCLLCIGFLREGGPEGGAVLIWM